LVGGASASEISGGEASTSGRNHSAIMPRRPCTSREDAFRTPEFNPDPTIQLCSFDVFDTTLTRVTAEPTGVFHLLQRRLARASLPLPEALLDGFPKLRVDAECQARTESKHQEVTLAEIYRVLAAPFQLGADFENELTRLELEEERQSIRPVARVLQWISRARELGRRVAFVSDIYLPVEFIREMLVRESAFQEGDGLYVSSEHRVMKATGRLFQQMLNTERCAPNAVWHIGDNLLSDVEVPYRLGIQAVHFSLAAGSSAK